MSTDGCSTLSTNSQQQLLATFLEQGQLEQLVEWFEKDIIGKGDYEQAVRAGETLCAEMWRQLGHRNPRAFLLPFLFTRLPGEAVRKLAHAHIALLVMFTGEVGEEVVARLFLQPTVSQGQMDDDEHTRWAILKEPFERLAKEKQDIILRLFPRIEIEKVEKEDEAFSISQILSFIYRLLGNKYQGYIEKQRTEYRELREQNWKVSDYLREFTSPANLTLNDLEAFEAQRTKFTSIERDAKRPRPREVTLLDFDVHLNPKKFVRGDAQIDYVMAVVDKVLQRNDFTHHQTDAYNIDYDPSVLEPIAKLYETGRLLSVISSQTLDSVRKILIPSIPMLTSLQESQQNHRHLIVYSEDVQIPRLLVLLALLGLDRACSARDVYCGRYYGREYVQRSLQIQFPLNKQL